jgi:hypothetical protein
LAPAAQRQSSRIFCKTKADPQLPRKKTCLPAESFACKCATLPRDWAASLQPVLDDGIGMGVAASTRVWPEFVIKTREAMVG